MLYKAYQSLSGSQTWTYLTIWVTYRTFSGFDDHVHCPKCDPASQHEFLVMHVLVLSTASPHVTLPHNMSYVSCIFWFWRQRRTSAPTVTLPHNMSYVSRMFWFCRRLRQTWPYLTTWVTCRACSGSDDNDALLPQSWPCLIKWVISRTCSVSVDDCAKRDPVLQYELRVVRGLVLTTSMHSGKNLTLPHKMSYVSFMSWPLRRLCTPPKRWPYFTKRVACVVYVPLFPIVKDYYYALWTAIRTLQYGHTRIIHITQKTRYCRGRKNRNAIIRKVIKAVKNTWSKQ